MAFICPSINTIYLDEPKWYSRSKPQLQIDILACLAGFGKLSKSKLQSHMPKRHYNDVSRAIDSLLAHEYISKANWKYGRGRPEKFYSISDKGLRLLLTDDPVPEKFWRIMIGFCHHSERSIDRVYVEDLFGLMLKNFLNYSSERGYVFHPDLFNDVEEFWLANYILRDSEIGLDQKVLEILSLYPQITNDKLLKLANEKDVESLRNIISMYSPVLHKPMIVSRKTYPRDGSSNSETLHAPNLLLHNMIIVRQDAKGVVKYELSLFGIMLVLRLIRYDQAGKLRHGLYYNSISSAAYFEKIADNYKQRLPLVFGKRHLLKRVLGTSMIDNFDIILDRKMRAKQLEASIFQGGNKEFYESIDSIIKSTRNEIIKIQSVGLERIFNYGAGNMYSNPKMAKLQPLMYKLLDISALLSPFDYDPTSYVEVMNMTIKGPTPPINTATLQAVAKEYRIETIENAFADTISLYYFLNLLSDRDALNRFLKCDDTRTISDGFSPQTDNYYPLSSKQIANLIFSQDEDIGIWLSNWVKDLLKHEHNKTMVMEKIQDEIGLN